MKPIFLLLAVAVSLAANPAVAAPEAEAPKTIRWVLAHTRDDSAYNALFDAFARRLSEKSGGGLKVEFVGSEAKDEDPDDASHRMVREGTADIGQFERDVAQHAPAIVAPFAFRGYAHAEAVFASPVGRKLRDGLYASSQRKLRALAFTYSGGQRVFFGKTAISKLSDFAGQRMRSPGNSGWSSAMDELMGKVGVRLGPVSGTFNLDAADQFEYVINRGPHDLAHFPGITAKMPFVNRTNHGMLVTAIVANEKFFAGLSSERRRLLTEEIETLAAEERKLSIELEPKRLAELEKLGMRSSALPAAERRKFMDAADAVLKKNPDLYRTILEIRAVKEGVDTASL